VLLKNEMENTIANIRILDVVRLVHGYFIFVFLIINMLSASPVSKNTTIAKQDPFTNKINRFVYIFA
jgi:hypothetical protein